MSDTKETRECIVSVALSPTEETAAKSAAIGEDRPLSNYIRSLILADLRTKKLLTEDVAQEA